MIKKNSLKKIIIISGPTAVGKTALSIELAKKYNGEIIGADSIQVYKHFNIGSAKITKTETEGITHHLIDFLEPEDEFNVKTFKDKANELIAQIHQRNKLPIIVGGTTFYITALIENYDLPSINRDPLFSEKIKDITTSKLYKSLKTKDPESAKNINYNNRKRIIRALEINHSGLSKSKIGKKTWEYKPLVLLLLPKSREEQLQKISLRVDKMVRDGLLEEVKTLYKKYPNTKAFESIGYKEFLPWIKNNSTISEAINKLKSNTNHYAKKQCRWIKNKIKGHIFYDSKPINKINDLVKGYLEFKKTTINNNESNQK